MIAVARPALISLGNLQKLSASMHKKLITFHFSQDSFPKIYLSVLWQKRNSKMPSPLFAATSKKIKTDEMVTR